MSVNLKNLSVFNILVNIYAWLLFSPLIVLQLKEMAEKMPEAQTAIVNSSTVSGQNGSNLNQLSTESLSMSINSRLESNGISKSQTLSTGIKTVNEKAEWVVQDEPGVYITLSALPGGFNELKRVRFRY